MFSDTYDAYIKSISKFTPLTKDDEIAICIKIQEGDKTAREKLINHNLKLVVKIAYSYHKFYDIMDIIQIGNVGLIKAVDSFDVNMGYNFSTFAFSYVSKYIMGRLQDTVNGQVHIPSSAFWEILRFKKTYEALSTEYEVPTVEMLCKETGFSPEKVKRYISFDINCLSLDLVNEQGDCFADCIEDDSDFSKEIEDRTIINDAINKIFNILKPREREIFTMYYGFGCKTKTMDEIGECLNLTKQRVSQIIETAKLKLRKNPELIQMVNLIYND